MIAAVCVRVAPGPDPEHVVGGRQPELLEEDLGEPPVVMLAGVDQDLFGPLSQAVRDGHRLDELRPVSYDGQDLHSMGVYTAPVQLTCPCCGAELDPSLALTGPDRLHRTPGSFPVAACRNCGTGVTVPRLAPTELARFYPERYGPYDAAQGGLAASISSLIQGWQGGGRSPRRPWPRSRARSQAAWWTSAAAGAIWPPI